MCLEIVGTPRPNSVAICCWVSQTVSPSTRTSRWTAWSGSSYKAICWLVLELSMMYAPSVWSTCRGPHAGGRVVSACRYYAASTGIPPVSRRRERRLSQGRSDGCIRGAGASYHLGPPKQLSPCLVLVDIVYHKTRTHVRGSDIIIHECGVRRPLPYFPKPAAIRAAVRRGRGGWSYG